MENIIKIEELRIGNYICVNNNGHPCRVMELTMSSVVVESIKENYNEPTIKSFNSIPLTEEWLLKFGFTKYEWNESYFIKTKFGDLMIQFFKNEIHLFFTNVGADSQGMKMYGRKYLGNINSTQNIKYVNQLQNLYFALTNKELEKL